LQTIPQKDYLILLQIKNGTDIKNTMKMKSINLLLIGLLIAGAAFLTACSKEARIEKNLWKKGGEWNIESLTVNQTSTKPQDNYTETIYNFGTMTFKEDGSGNYRFTFDGDVETGTFTYSNSKDKLTLIIGNEKRVFDMDWKKDDLQITIIESFTNDDDDYTYTETLNLKKK
jgi:hypothetical protein